MGMCLNHKVLIGLGIVAAAVLIAAPQAFLAALPVLFLLACPLSMVFMMRGMGRNHGGGDQTGRPADSVDSRSTPITPDQSAEVARLRAEIDQLRAGLRDRRQLQRAGGAE